MKCAALLNGRFVHYLDHLAPLCALLDIPLVTDEFIIAESARRYYPGVAVIELSPFELTPAFLDRHFDLLFVTEKYKRSQMAPHLKKSRFCYVPHGNSDKGRLSDALNPYPLQERALIYGEQMANFVTIPSIRIGNFRKDYYERFKQELDAMIDSELSLDPDRLTLLYAPTWQDGERGSSFVPHAASLLSSLPDNLQILVKLHPLLLEQEIARSFTLIERYRDHPHIHFVHELPLIYPLLARCDLYLGDYSSMGYDFLAFDRPLFFFHTAEKNPPELLKAGLCIPADVPTFSFIKKNLGHNLSKQRNQLYHYAFDRVPSKESLLTLLRGDHARDSD